jgi:hypothetical protein
VVYSERPSTAFQMKYRMACIRFWTRAKVLVFPFAEWLKRLSEHPAVSILFFFSGILIALATFSTNITKLFVNLSDVADRIQLWGVARHYVGPGGRDYMRLYEGYWVESTNGKSTRFIFDQVDQDKEFVYLRDPSRVKNFGTDSQPRYDPKDPMVVRIPIKGGLARWKYKDDTKWTDLFFLCREFCLGERAKAP